MCNLLRKNVGARLDITIERKNSIALPDDFRLRKPFARTSILQLASNVVEFGDRGVGRVPRLQRHTYVRGGGKVMEYENHPRDGCGQDTAATERLLHLFLVEATGCYGVPRPAIRHEYFVITLKIDEICGVTADRICFKINHRLLLCLRPKTLAVQKTGESDLNLQGSPGQS
ncbi:MAG: hypothetical protein ABI227_10015 [Rhodanobacter sp.]